MPDIIDQTPASLGYTFPPEWHRHRATWFSWPRSEGISFPDKYKPIPSNLAAIIRHIAPREEVHINVPNLKYASTVRNILRKHRCPMRNIFFHEIPTNECWCRDHGPAFVLRKRRGKTDVAIVDWIFNSWGHKYPRFKHDDAVPTRIAEELNLPVFYPDIVMEGGAVDFNGRGTVLTTESCLLHKNRNPGLSKKRIEKFLKEYYGQKHVVWLEGGIIGDDTDGHIDDVARFINPRTIVIGVEENRDDANYWILRENLRRLKHAKDQSGRNFKIVRMPMPGVVEHRGQRLPATYMNFYFVNGAVLVPTYRHPNDRQAIEILQSHLPKHEVIGIDCVELSWGLGAIHCLTQQQPMEV
jgi:agmatine deiminase